MRGRSALFEGMISTTTGEPVQVATIAGVPHYAIPDGDFLRHIESQIVDRQVLGLLRDQLEPHRELAILEAMKMLGRDDLFTKAMIDASIDNMEQLLEQGIPQEVRAWLGMMGFRVVVDYHGEVVDVEQPGQIAPED